MENSDKLEKALSEVKPEDFARIHSIFVKIKGTNILYACPWLMGMSRSRKKRDAVRENGKKGGRPKGSRDSYKRTRKPKQIEPA